MMRFAVLLVGTLCWSPLLTADGSAIGWRRDGSGHFAAQNPPVRWSANDNVVWKVPLPAQSKGSPIVVGDRIFLLSYPHTLVCVETKAGKILWQKTHAYSEALPASEAARLDRENPIPPEENVFWPKGDGLTQTTPVADRETVYAAFGTGVVSAHSHGGERRWIRFVERPEIKYGLATSPVLAGGSLIVHLNDLLALDPRTGRERWRTKLAPSHATPAVTAIGETAVLIHPSGALVRASDGKVLARDLFKADRASPIVAGDKVYVHGATHVYAVQLPPDTTTAPRLIWKTKCTYGGYTIASPILYEGRLYGTSRKGMFEVFDALSGSLIYRERLGLGNKVYSGISLAGGALYVGNELGTHLVLQTGASYKVLARNELGERIDAAPVFSGERLYLRGGWHLFCIGE